MKQPNISSLFETCSSTLLSYLTSSMPVGNHRSQEKLGKAFFNRWQKDLFRGPFIEMMPPYVKSSALADMAADSKNAADRDFFSMLHPKYVWRDIEVVSAFKRFAHAKRILWQHEPWAETEATPLHSLWGRKLYQHQVDAFENISRPRNTVIATGTGSGKTEAFLLPLLRQILTEPRDIRRHAGVRAILLYPMNALVEDQMARLRRLLFWINLRAFDGSHDLQRPVTFGRYTGQTPINDRDHSIERAVSEEEINELGEIRYREEMQKKPPDILVTNFTMLEYMLLRNDDRALFANPNLLKSLVLDELHTYGGTVGMEVGTLLRRLTQYLGKQPGKDFICVGTSATLGEGAPARRSMAAFASILFGASFEDTDIIVGKQHRRARPREPSSLLDESDVNALLDLPSRAPTFCEAFALTHTGAEADDIPEDEWINVLKVLKARLEPEELRDLATRDRTEALGAVMVRSAVFRSLNNVLECSKDVLTLTELAEKVFALEGLRSGLDKSKRVLGTLLQLALAGRVSERSNLAVRCHLFVREFRQAFVCVNPGDSADLDESDGWWSSLSFVHRNACSSCGAMMYPIVLCRKCGFVLIEGWIRDNKVVCAERDDLLGAQYFQRVLLRPFNSLPLHIQADVEENEKRGLLCTHCGIRFPNDHPEYQRAAVERHSCGQQGIIDIALWQSKDGGDYQMIECPYCEQEWIKGQEIISYPHVSLYAAASVLIEELKRQIDEPLQGTGLVNKLLCFSDGRQQAASIAARLQRINEDFTFRQVLYSVLSASGPLKSRALLSKLTERVSDDPGLCNLFCEREEVNDPGAVRKRLATHLLKETCSEYRTLESLGITLVEVPDELTSSMVTALEAEYFGRALNAPDRSSFAKALIDWLFRSRRWAVYPGTQFFAEELLPIGYQDRCLMRFGDSRSNIAGFSLKNANRRSHIFDYYQRISLRTRSSVLDGSLPILKGILEHIWDDVICNPKFVHRQGAGLTFVPEASPFCVIDGNCPENYRLKLNWASLNWSIVSPEAGLYVCDTCGVHTHRATLSVCPVRECSGTLRATTLQEVLRKPFSPARHYYTLLTTKTPKPLWIEEHTAQISPRARREIEMSFKREDLGSVDVVSGSTTFEMGVDLGNINAAFLANMPPEPANYRQRAGRAGRRTGMFPVVVTYVRERPHDVYFWNRLDEFIAGPIRVPRLAQPSYEVLLRHANAAFFAAATSQMPGRQGLEGPPANEFVSFALAPSGLELLKSLATDRSSQLSGSLVRIVAGNPSLGLTPIACLDRFRERLEHFRANYLALHLTDGAIPTLSDYGILPSYNYPIYVDELRLPEIPLTEWPRSALKLQRDRAIALREYYPGRIILAGKAPIESIGLWEGFQYQEFQYCGTCQLINTKSRFVECPNGCGPLVLKKAVKPLGGFIGRHEPKLRRMDPELFAVTAGQILFDPANNPPPTLDSYGAALRAARQTSFNIDKSGARMRTFAPGPSAKNVLELASTIKSDVGIAGKRTFRCLVLPKYAAGAPEAVHLMHEFTTDIVRLVFRPNSVGELLLSSGHFKDKFERCVLPEERRKVLSMSLLTIAQALCSGGARHLSIDPKELAFTFRRTMEPALYEKEIIIFDTASGGAGYCDQLLDDLRGWIESAVDVLDCESRCGDSCYGCLRAYENQQMHAHFDRFLVLDGLRELSNRNWTVATGA